MINIPASKRLSGVWRRTALAWLAVCSISCAADIVNVQSYDWFDNGKSAGIAFPKSDGNPTVHNQATQGVGTYTDPGTFAASKKDFPVGSFIYIPVFQKYFVMEDSGAAGAVNLWVGPSDQPTRPNALAACEDFIAVGKVDIIKSPKSRNLVVDRTPFFKNGNCTAHLHHHPAPHPRPSPSPRPHPTPSPSPTPSGTEMMELTFFGARDNCPPGGAIAYPKIHKQAGGVGTFADPITFAGAEKALKVGSVVYIPKFEKYFIFEDSCEGCENDWRDKKKLHIDLWMGPDTLGQGPLIACENALTSLEPQPVIVNATEGHKVNTTPFFTYEKGCIVDAPPCHNQGNVCGNLCELWGDLGGKSCPSLAHKFFLNYTRFEQLNPHLDCTKPVPDGTTVCIGGTCGGR